MLKLIKKLLGAVSKAPEADRAPPGLQVVIGPHYWIETHYDCIERLPHPYVLILKKAVEGGYIKDVANEITTAAMTELKNTFLNSLQSLLHPSKVMWRLRTEDGVLITEMQATEQKHWTLVTEAWEQIQKNLASLGIQTALTEKQEDRQNRRMLIRFPFKQMKLDLDSAVCWEVLNKHKNDVILWNSKVWVPKK